MTTGQKTMKTNWDNGSESENSANWMAPDRLSKYAWGVVFIWAGVVALGGPLGYVETWRRAILSLPYTIPFEVNGWSIFFVGAAIVALNEAAVRIAKKEYRKHLWGSLTAAGFAFAMGTGAWGVIVPVFMIAIGISLLPRLASRTR